MEEVEDEQIGGRTNILAPSTHDTIIFVFYLYTYR